MLPQAVAVAVFCVTQTPGRAGTLIDWLAFTPGADRTHFGLVNDLGQPVAQAEIAIAAGALAPLSPTAGSLGGSFWTDPLDYIDSIQNDGTVSTTKVQVAPRAGVVQFQLGVQGADLSGMVVAVGQLFNSELDGTREVGLMAKTLSGLMIALEFLAEEQWDNGLRAYNQSLNWDGAKLTLPLTASGESGFAFFRVPTSSIPVTQLLFDIPDAYALGSGDALEFAFGLPIPEPTTGVLILAAVGAAALSRVRPRHSHADP